MAEIVELLVSNVDDGTWDRTSSWSRGDIVHVAAQGYAWGNRECINAWIKSGNKEIDFPGSFYIIEVEMPLIKAQELISSNNFPFRVRNWNLDILGLPDLVKNKMQITGRKMESGVYRHRLSMSDLDSCLRPRVGTKKPSDL